MSLPIVQLQELVTQVQGIVESINDQFQAPELVSIEGMPFFRHRERDDLLLSQLKCIRAVSSLNACLVLLKHGYVQEIGALCRCIDEFTQDVLFLSTTLGEGSPSEQQKRLVNEFFQEEFDDMRNVINATQERNRVPRSKVIAGIARMPGQPLNPNDAQRTHQTVQQGFSGYVHGAYVHIMELYGGSSRDNLHYHMNGMSNTSRISEWSDQLITYIYRTMIAVEIVATRCGDDASVKNMSTVRTRLEQLTKIGLSDPNEILKRAKK